MLIKEENPALTSFQGDFRISTLTDNFFGVTPILTVFFPGNGSGSLVSQPEAQLTCVKTIDLTTASNNNISPSAANTNATGRHLAVWIALVSVAFALVLS